LLRLRLRVLRRQQRLRPVPSVCSRRSHLLYWHSKRCVRRAPPRTLFRVLTYKSIVSLDYNWYCSLTTPPGAYAAGDGEWCYTTAAECEGATLHACMRPPQADDLMPTHAVGPNTCGPSIVSQCVVDRSVCSTGQAAGSGAVYYCPFTRADGAAMNGAGCVLCSSLFLADSRNYFQQPLLRHS